jgi:hypothetical protein
MSSVPDFLLSTVIPEPSEAALRGFTPLGILTWGENMLTYYWWDEPRKVVVWAQRYGLWLLQDDCVIRDSLADVLGCSADALETWNLMLFDGPDYHHGLQLPEKMAELFLVCEWSDYACDHRPVTGHLSIRFGDVHPVASSADVSSNDSLSDDEAPPSPRRWQRWHSYK